MLMMFILFSDLRLARFIMILNFMGWRFLFLQINHFFVYCFKICLKLVWWWAVLKVGPWDVWDRATRLHRCALDQPWLLEKCFNRIWSYCCWDLGDVTRIVDWFIDRCVNWFSWMWSYNGNRRNWWQYVLINNFSGRIYREWRSIINIYLRMKCSHVMNWILMNISNELNLWNDLFRRISNHEITSTENICSIVSDPRLKLLLT